MKNKTKAVKLGSIDFRLEAVQNATDQQATDIYLYGDVGDGWWGETIRADRIKEILQETPSDTINIHIQSYGGDVFEGITIYNLLRNSKKAINVYVDGIAASSASIIALAGDKLIMPKNTQFMIHNPWTYTWGNANEMEKVVAQLRTCENSIIATYMEKFVGTEDELRQLLDAETFMTAEEAVAFGFADELLEEDEEKTEPALSVSARLMNKYGNKPKNQSQEEVSKDERPNPLQNFVNIFKEEK